MRSIHHNSPSDESLKIATKRREASRDTKAKESENMKRGDVVDVYQKPYTKEDFEGKATLKRFVRSDVENYFEYWMVEFMDEPLNQYQRKVCTK
jgi:hypothetical protein